MKSPTPRIPEDPRVETLKMLGGVAAKVNGHMLPEEMMDDTEELRHWIARAFKLAASQPPKAKKPKKTASATRSAKGR